MSGRARKAAAVDAAWGADEFASARIGPWVPPTTLAALAAVVVAAGVGLGWGWLAAVAVAMGIAVALGAWIVAADRGIVRKAGGRRVSAAEEPRLHNIALGLAERLGMPPPALYVCEGPPNALAVPGRAAQVVVARSLLDSFSRTEIEAVVAHCLIRTREATFVDRALLALGMAPRGVAADDVRAAAVTRYPPALAAAIRKATPRRGRDRAAWLVGDGSPTPEDRAGALLDL